MCNTWIWLLQVLVFTSLLLSWPLQTPELTCTLLLSSFKRNLLYYSKFTSLPFAHTFYSDAHRPALASAGNVLTHMFSAPCLMQSHAFMHSLPPAYLLNHIYSHANCPTLGSVGTCTHIPTTRIWIPRHLHPHLHCPTLCL